MTDKLKPCRIVNNTWCFEHDAKAHISEPDYCDKNPPPYRTPDARLEAERAVIEAAKAYEKKFPGEAFRKSPEGHALVAALAALARTEKKP